MTPRDERTLARRWERWKPWCLLEVKRGSDMTLLAYKASHRLRVALCLDNQVSWERIQRTSIDDPRIPFADFHERLRTHKLRSMLGWGRKGRSHMTKDQRRQEALNAYR